MPQPSDAATEAGRLARSAFEVVCEGGQTVLRLVSTMDASSHSSQHIGDIVGVIDGVAFQTSTSAPGF
jgi:methyl-accepting chemotaxis protein